MSSGPFILSRYRASYNGNTQIHPIKIQPETTGLQFGTEINVPAIENPTNPISARVTGSKRTIGLNARKVAFRFTSADPIDGRYKEGSILVLPWLLPFTAALARGTTGTYLGAPIVLVGLIPEVAQ